MNEDSLIIDKLIMKEDAIKVALELLYLLDVMEFPIESIQSAFNICKKYKVNLQKELKWTDEELKRYTEKYDRQI